MGSGIFGIFFAIRIYESSPAVAAVSAYVAFANCGVFNVIFHRAGDLPENMGNYKSEIRRLGKREMVRSSKEEGGVYKISRSPRGLPLGGKLWPSP